MSAKARRKVGNLKTSLNISSAKLYLECFSFHIYMYINPKIKFTVPQHKWFLLILVICLLIISAHSSQLQRFLQRFSSAKEMAVC